MFFLRILNSCDFVDLGWFSLLYVVLKMHTCIFEDACVRDFFERDDALRQFKTLPSIRKTPKQNVDAFMDIIWLLWAGMCVYFTILCLICLKHAYLYTFLFHYHLSLLY